MNSNNNERSITLYIALFMHICAIGYLASVHFNVVLKHNIPWDSDMGTLMLIIPVMLVIYSWIILLNEYLSRPIQDNNDQWIPHDHHLTDKHAGLWEEHREMSELSSIDTSLSSHFTDRHSGFY